MPQPAVTTDAFEQARALFIEGLDHLGAGRWLEADRCFSASLEHVPGRVSTLLNLAATRLKLARASQALDLANEVIAIEPDNTDAWFHRGTAQASLGQHADALVSFERLLSLNSQLAEAWLRHGQTLQSLNRHAEALPSYDRALALDGTLAQAWTLRGTLLRETHRLAEAAHAFEQALAHGADPALTSYYLASVRTEHGPAPATAPPAYVQHLFDDYASDFDNHLVEVLHYRAHVVLARLARQAGPARFQSALELGCGTGLCGPLVKPMADRLTGVDLSASMMAKAATLGVYDSLVQAEVAAHLNATDQRHDLVLAADVFIYVGDLDPIFAGVARVLDSGGVFCFSAERCESETDDFRLLPSLRYAHSERHLRVLAARHGFKVRQLLDETIREDQQHPVDGLFVCLTR